MYVNIGFLGKPVIGFGLTDLRKNSTT